MYTIVFLSIGIRMFLFNLLGCIIPVAVSALYFCIPHALRQLCTDFRRVEMWEDAYSFLIFWCLSNCKYFCNFDCEFIGSIFILLLIRYFKGINVQEKHYIRVTVKNLRRGIIWNVDIIWSPKDFQLGIYPYDKYSLFACHFLQGKQESCQFVTRKT